MRSSVRAESSVIVSGLCSLLVIVFTLRGALSVALIGVALVASLLAAASVRSDGTLPRMLWPTVAVVCVSAVVMGPIASHDLWSYAFYGRMVSHHGVDAYQAVPAMFPDDVVYPVVGWRDIPSGYGPLFTALSALITWVAGDSLLTMRLAFQLLAAGAVVWCLAVLARARRHAALTLVALAPFVWVSLVNGAHNDAIVAAFLLAAVVAFDRDRVVRCGVLVGLAVGLKLTAVFVVVPLVVILIARRRMKDAVVVAAIPAAVLASSALLIEGSLTNATTATREIITRASIWRPFQLLVEVHPATITRYATVTTFVLVFWIAWRHRGDQEAPRAAGGALSSYAMVSGYTYPWYLYLGFPILALSGDLVLLGIVSVRATVMAAGYQYRAPEPLSENLDRLNAVTSVLLVAAFVWRISRRVAPDHPERAAQVRSEPPQQPTEDHHEGKVHRG